MKANRRGFFGILAAAGTTAASASTSQKQPIKATIYLDGKELAAQEPFADITNHSGDGWRLKTWKEK